MPVLVLPLFEDLVASLDRLSHLVGDVKLHIVHGHLHYVVGLIYLLQLLLGFVTENFNFRLATLLCLLQFVIESALSLGEELFPTLFGDLLAEANFFVPFLF
jgi:hypothetical protein